MKHDWKQVTCLEEKHSHRCYILARVRKCETCNIYQQLETVYDHGSYSVRGGPKVRGYRWLPHAGRCA